MRLNKYISFVGVASRRKAEELIDKGLVKVNGNVIKEYWYDVNIKKDVVEINGKVHKPSKKHITILLNKPPRTLVSYKSQGGKTTIFEYLPDFKNKKLYYAGRLDYLSEGALILTTDGEFANYLVHPSSHIPKKYKVRIDKRLEKEDIRALKKGLLLTDTNEKLQPVKILNQKPYGKTKMWNVILVLEEGKKRQIRRMLKQLGYNVQHLVRISIGDIGIKRLPKGQWRYLTYKEIETLKNWHAKGDDNEKN